MNGMVLYLKKSVVCISVVGSVYLVEKTTILKLKRFNEWENKKVSGSLDLSVAVCM